MEKFQDDGVNSVLIKIIFKIKNVFISFEITQRLLLELHPCFDGHCTHECEGADEKVLQNEAYK